MLLNTKLQGEKRINLLYEWPTESPLYGPKFILYSLENFVIP